MLRGSLKHLATLMATEVPITSEHALLAGSLSAEHRDPFDRLLAAQALVEGVPLLTADPAFSALRVETVWPIVSDPIRQKPASLWRQEVAGIGRRRGWVG